MNKAMAAREIEKAYLAIVAKGETISLYKIWYAIEKYDMTEDELYAGAKHLAGTRDDVLLSPALYPWQYSQKELDCGPVYGGQKSQTLMIAR